MADLHWTSYVGMVTGIVGAITGVSGAIIGYVSYRKSNKVKLLCLRLELRKAINHFNSILSQTEELLPYANQSRERVAAATCNLHSGAMVAWKEQYENDQSALDSLTEEARHLNKNYEVLSPAELEMDLVDVHELQNRLNELKERYNNVMRVDDIERDHIRNRHEPR